MTSRANDGQSVLTKEEERELESAFVHSRSSDTFLITEAKASAKRRWRKRIWSVSVIVLVIAAAICAIVASHPSREETSGTNADLLALSPVELSATIKSLEENLRKPGKASHYVRLGEAYGRQYTFTNNSEDLLKAKAALSKGQELMKKQYEEGDMINKPVIFFLLFVVIIIALVCGYFMFLYNGLVRTDEAVDERWSQVETVLQRRLDLLPGLVNAVKGYAQHERGTLTQVMEARGRLLSALKASGGSAPKTSETTSELGAAQENLGLALGRLLVVVEQYPDLKASSNFIALQDQLEGTENRIAVERERYNVAVRAYNVELRKFPSTIVAGMFGFEPRSYFESKLKADEPVTVEF